MKITKLGHCCLVIEENGVRIMTDPGAWSTLQSEEKGIDYIFITHEHQDHFHLESLKKVLANNPRARVVTNRGVGALLTQEGIAHEILEHGQSGSFGGVSVEGCGEKHAVIYEEFGQVQNTGYFFANRFFYSGDAFYNPGKPVPILALPVAGSWMKISEAIDYAKLIKPKICFPVHDGMLKIFGPFHGMSQTLLKAAGIAFEVLKEGDSREF
ncbi:MAG: beta-lactamase-like protein [Parcubacteria group bacterium Greene0416_79]|nr:MAG: beta-lactamase-like protein [Parcubacteria group bacterium Greene0416_79]